MDPFSATHQTISDITVVLVGAIAFIGYPLARAYAKRLGSAGPRQSRPMGACWGG
jgi:hypothetical protein